MSVRNKIQKFRSTRKKYIVTLVLAVIVVILGVNSMSRSKARTKLVYMDSLDQVAATVNETDITLRQAAFYVAYEEGEVEKQAEIYEPEKTKEYWNLHIDGQFVKTAASNAAIQMAIHDEIFYEMAVQDEITLTDQEETYLKNSEYDFWSDLTDIEGETKLGVTEDDIMESMRKAAIAEKYQEIYENLQGVEEGDYDFNGDSYEDLLKENKFEIHSDVWKRVDFGNVTLDHE